MRRLLIANRGEIARRIQRTARSMGLQTVSVFTESDRQMPFVREADRAVRISSYLDPREIVEAAQRTSADAVHPGYGFLSENAQLAQACIDASLTWVGPLPRSIAHMGSKLHARAIAESAGVPLLPATDDPARAAEIGFPLLVKASAGGGGRGMRLAQSAEQLADAISSAQREAEAAFGNGTIYLERYWPAARHIEVQIAADQHGTVIHVWDRECSIQRRHQKVIEEALAPGLRQELRERLFDAALRLVRGLDHPYIGLGTVEFLVKDEEFAFLEMNTRLQVEHPVTEAVTGLDLVRLQLEIAAGVHMWLRHIEPIGHAIEARVYAEDPAREFLPSIGRVHRFVHDDAVRWDDGVESGSEITPDYDGLLAKAIAHGHTREEAIARVSRALRALQVHGVQTNRDALVAILESEPFRNGQVTTDFLERHSELLSPCIPDEVRAGCELAARLVLQHRRQMSRAVLRFVPPAWRNVPTHQPRADYLVSGISEEHVDLECDGVQQRYRVHSYGDEHYVNTPQWQVQVTPPPRFGDADSVAVAAGPSAPLPGTVRAVLVRPGDRVTRGQPLIVLDAMKIEHRIAAGADGAVAEVRVRVGDRVDAHQLLVVLE